MVVMSIYSILAHEEFINMGEEKIKSFGKKNHLLYDMKYIFNPKTVDARL